MEDDPLMPWLKFTRDFDWQPPGARWMVAYKAGSVMLVQQEAAEKAIREGKAEPTERPRHAGRRAKVQGGLLQP